MYTVSYKTKIKILDNPGLILDNLGQDSCFGLKHYEVIHCTLLSTNKLLGQLAMMGGDGRSSFSSM